MENTGENIGKRAEIEKKGLILPFFKPIFSLTVKGFSFNCFIKFLKMKQKQFRS